MISCPVLAEVHTGAVYLKGNWSDSDVMWSDVQAILDGEPVDIWVFRNGDRTPVSVRLLAGDGLPARLAPDRVEPLTLRSAHRMFLRLPRPDAMTDIREQMIDPFQPFQGATRSAPRSVAASVERNLLYLDPGDPNRYDNQLDRAAKHLTDALAVCLAEVEDNLRAHKRRFLDEQERRRRTGRASGDHSHDN